MSRCLLAAALLCAAPVHALPPALQAVDIEEHLGARLPRGLILTDQDGRRVSLTDYFQDGKPVLLVLAYFRCAMLCDLVLQGTTSGLGRLEGLRLGRDFRALTVSFDPRDTPAAAAQKQHGLLQAMNAPRQAAWWPFLVGDEATVRRLADALGFLYAYDPKGDQYAHPACLFVLTPDGRIARYLYGAQFAPLDLRLALDEAAGGRIGGIVDRVLLRCFRYDPATRRYAVYVSGVLRGGSALVLVVVGAFLALLWRRERQRARR